MQEITNNKEIDKFELHLLDMIKKLKNCQNEKMKKTCSDCEDYFACELRTNYVNSVYNSMSKGDTGGFEF